MSKTFKKILSVVLSVLSVTSMCPNAFAASYDSHKFAKENFLSEYDNTLVSNAFDFMYSEGFINEYIMGYDVYEDCVAFKMNYLPNNEESTIIYSEDTDAITLDIIEGNKHDTFIYSNSRISYISAGEEIATDLFTVNQNISPYTTVATSFYTDLTSVPGYNYWSTHQFQTRSPLNSISVDISANMTVWAVAKVISIKYTGSNELASIFVDFANALIQSIISHNLASAIVDISNNTKYIYNPTTLQYLYMVQTKSAFLGTLITNDEYFYRLETYV